MREDRFNFFIPLDDSIFEKAGQDSPDYSNMIVQGVASDNTTDADGEVLEPDGYILDRFLKNGLINYNHLSKNDPSFVIGEPIEAYVRNGKFFVKGKLYENQPMARKTWDAMIAMNKSGAKRKMGWSIEGKALERDPMNRNRIKRALITGIALTLTPVNGNSFADIVKGVQTDDFVNYKYDSKIDPNGGGQYILDVLTDSGVRVRVNSDFQILIDKCMSTVTGGALMRESLDEDLKVLVDRGRKLKKFHAYKKIPDSVFISSLNKLVKNF